MTYKRGMRHLEEWYFLGIAGHTMSGLAVAAKRQGHVVTGVDAGAYPPATDALDACGIHYFTSFDVGHLREGMTVVLGNAVPIDNVELLQAQRLGLRIVSYPELVEQLTVKQQRIVVAGTHGKTTTATLIAWLLEGAGQQPDFIIGMSSRNFGQSVRLEDAKTVVIEGDEYASSALDRRSKFEHYHPTHVVITSIEWDHPDLFASAADAEARFDTLLANLDKDVVVVACWDDAGVRKVVERSGRKVVWYGLDMQATWQAREIEYGPSDTQFQVMREGVALCRITSPLAGEHNVRNVLAVLCLLDSLGVSPAKVALALLQFRGALRRFEVVASINDIHIIDDYAHHPTEVAATLQAAKARYSSGRVWAFFVPHTYSRTLALLAEYGQAFGLADFVLIGELEAAREKNQEMTISSQDIVALVKRVNTDVHYVVDLEQARHMLVDNVAPGDVIVCMSVSGANHFAQQLGQALEEKWA